MWSPRFDKRRPQRLLEEPPNVTRKMRGLDSGANARSDDEKLSDFRHCWRRDPAVSDEVRKTEARPAGRAWVIGIKYWTGIDPDASVMQKALESLI